MTSAFGGQRSIQLSYGCGKGAHVSAGAGGTEARRGGPGIADRDFDSRSNRESIGLKTAGFPVAFAMR